jgi:hypothetical protein
MSRWPGDTLGNDASPENTLLNAERVIEIVVPSAEKSPDYPPAAERL